MMVANTSRWATPKDEAFVEISLVPFDEASYASPASRLNEIAHEVMLQQKNLEDYDVKVIPSGNHGGSRIRITARVMDGTQGNQKALVNFFGVGVLALQSLTQFLEVEDVEVILDGKTIKMKDGDKLTAQILLNEFRVEDFTLGRLSSSKPRLKIIAMVSELKGSAD